MPTSENFFLNICACRFSYTGLLPQAPLLLSLHIPSNIHALGSCSGSPCKARAIPMKAVGLRRPACQWVGDVANFISRFLKNWLWNSNPCTIEPPLCLLLVHFLHTSFSDTWFLYSIYITWLKTLPQPIKRLLWNPKLWLKGWSFPELQYLCRWLILTACSTEEKVAFSLQVHTVWAFPWELLVLSRLLF